ncbi:hypothetical protein C8R45DRAFT_945562 [Mycena sanguinolenta]|nr:hypothetical protein C8R45DRAFT_945562 [Mycena sanguinolenta]
MLAGFYGYITSFKVRLKFHILKLLALSTEDPEIQSQHTSLCCKERRIKCALVFGTHIFPMGYMHARLSTPLDMRAITCPGVRSTHPNSICLVGIRLPDGACNSGSTGHFFPCLINEGSNIAKTKECRYLKPSTTSYLGNVGDNVSPIIAVQKNPDNWCFTSTGPSLSSSTADDVEQGHVARARAEDGAAQVVSRALEWYMKRHSLRNDPNSLILCLIKGLKAFEDCDKRPDKGVLSLRHIEALEQSQMAAALREWNMACSKVNELPPFPDLLAELLRLIPDSGEIIAQRKNKGAAS